ncbi:MAG TPA: hypothetical protein VNG33_17255, partial [Polyangiaceae bacterium]|nr:hypothetical protein [Polyangiaceae bacterium]
MTHFALPGAAISCAAALALLVSARPALAQTPPAEAPPSEAAPAPGPNTATPEAAQQKAEPSAPTPTSGGSPAPSAAPAALPAEEAKASWFARPALRVEVGSASKQQWSLTFYGFVEADFIADSTRSYGDSIGASLVARSDTYKGRAGRTQFSMRNTRLGLKFASPELGGFRPLAVLEGDFFGPSSIAETSENTVYTSPTFRIRHAFVSLESDYLNVLAGQTYDVFGWQNYFFPCSVEFLGLPNQVFSRSTQFRLSHTFGGDGPVTLDVAAAAARPAQRDSRVPDAHAGLRLGVPSFKGVTTPGSSGTTALPLSVGVSGVFRQFRVNAFAPPPAQSSNGTSGWGVSLDALVPVISAHDADDRGNRLTLTGSFVTGSGIADLITSNGGAGFPTLPNPAQANPPPEYDADIDPGLVSFDTQGVLHTIDWQAFRAGLQYYLPPSGRLMLSANYTQAHSKNMAKLFPKGGAEIELLGRVVDTSRYADVNLFWD